MAVCFFLLFCSGFSWIISLLLVCLFSLSCERCVLYACFWLIDNACIYGVLMYSVLLNLSVA